MSKTIINEIETIWNRLSSQEKVQVLKNYLESKNSPPNQSGSPISATNNENRVPKIITGPSKLVAILTFRKRKIQIIKNKRNGKSKKNKSAPQEKPGNFCTDSHLNVDEIAEFEEAGNDITIKEKTYPPVPSWNDWIDGQRSGWSGREMTRYWNEVGEDIGKKYLEDKHLEPLNLKWAAITVVANWPNFLTRDVTNQCLKGIIDGLTKAGYWTNDSGIIDARFAHGGVNPIDPKVEVFIYEINLTPEQEILIRGELDENGKVKRSSLNNLIKMLEEDNSKLTA